MSKADFKPYTDPALRGKGARVRLAARMAAAGMMVAVSEKRGTVDLFTVIKKLSSEGRISRLVFDERVENLGWLPPPHCALAAGLSFPMIDLATEVQAIVSAEEEE